MKTNFKKQISILSLVLSSMLIFSSCEEKPWSEDYDIEWPVTTIENVTPLTAAPGDVLTITGQNLNYTLN